MSLRSFEGLMLREAKTVVGKRGLRLKDIQEWRTFEFTPNAGERMYWLPDCKVWIAVLETAIPKFSQAAKDC